MGVRSGSNGGGTPVAAQWTLEDLYRGVVRSWYVLVGTVVAFILIAMSIYAVFPQTYTAEAQHTVEPISVLSTGSTFNTVNMETERVVATSATVLERAAEQSGASPTQLRDATVIEVPRGSQVLTFNVTTESASDSAEWANALALAYGEQRTVNARTVVEQTAAELSNSIQRLQALYDSQPADSSERAATQLQLQALLDQQARLTATPFFAGILVTPATEPSESNRPSVYVFIAAGLFLGLLLGGIAALIVSRLRRGAVSSYRRATKFADTGGMYSDEGSAPPPDPFPLPDEGLTPTAEPATRAAGRS